MAPPPEPDARRPGVGALLRRTRQDLTLRREADMMGFYLAIALLAALSTGNDHARHTQFGVFKVIWGTAIGLALAHWFALTASAHLVRDPDLHHTPSEVLFSQIAMGLLLAAVATSAVLVLPPDTERLGARLTAAVFIAVLVLVESRAGGSTNRRAMGNSGLSLAIAAAIAIVKWFIGK